MSAKDETIVARGGAATVGRSHGEGLVTPVQYNLTSISLLR